jgi:hypothetical protein
MRTSGTICRISWMTSMTFAMPLMGGTGDRPRRSSAPPEVSHLMRTPEPGHAPGFVVYRLLTDADVWAAHTSPVSEAKDQEVTDMRDRPLDLDEISDSMLAEYGLQRVAVAASS